LALDVFGGMTPRANEFVRGRLLASDIVERDKGFSEGVHFLSKYAVLLNKWRAQFSLTLNRGIVNATF
jgi:hypothetical protein